MVGAVADLIDAGRVKLYCVDSADARPWSDRSRADRGAGPAARRLRAVDPRRGRPVDRRGLRRRAARSSRSAAASAPTTRRTSRCKHADVFPLAMCFSGNYDPTAWHALGRARRRHLLQQPDGLRRATCTATTSTGCGSRVSLLLVVGQGAWEVDPTGALPSTREFADRLADKGIRHELDVWGYDVPHDWPSWQAPAAPPPAAVLLKRRTRDRLTHLIGLLLGTEEDWPTAFEAHRPAAGRGHRRRRRSCTTTDVERITDRTVRSALQAALRPGDRPARVLVLPPARVAEEGRADGRRLPAQQPVHLPEHGEARGVLRDDAARPARCPETVLVPFKNPPENAKYAYTAAGTTARSTSTTIAERIGYPLFMKPYDGGAWVGVSQIRNRDELHRAYDESGQRLMHLQKAVDGLRRLRPQPVDRRRDDGDEVRPRPADARPLLGRPRLPRRRESATRRSRSGGSSTPSSAGSSTPARRSSRAADVYPIDYANACPDVAITSLHYYFPWAMKALVQVVGLLHRHRARAALRPGHPSATSTSPTARTSSYADKLAGLPSAGRRLLRGGAIQRLLRQPARRTWTRSSLEWVESARSSTAARRHRALDVPRARARPVHRPLPRPARVPGRVTSVHACGALARKPG